MAKYSILAALLLVGCAGEAVPVAAQSEWDAAPRTHVCTVEQMSRVERESKFCDDNTSFFSSYCYGTAIMRNCTKRGQP